MWSIRRRLTRHLLLAFGLLTGGALVLAASVVSLALRHALDSELRERVAAMSSLTEILRGQVKYDFSADFLRSYDGLEHTGRYFELWDQAGKSLVRSPSLGASHLLRPVLAPGAKARIHDRYLAEGRHVRLIEKAYFPELETPAERAQPVWLALAVDRSGLDLQIAAVWCASAGGALLAILVVAALVPPVLRRGLSSLEALSAQTGRIDADSLATRFTVGELPGELQPIGLALNALLESGNERERSSRSMLATSTAIALVVLFSILIPNSCADFNSLPSPKIGMFSRPSPAAFKASITSLPLAP